MPGHAPADWATESALKKLRAWWPDLTISTSEIGRRLGASKNAIVGKAHRMKLVPRPSPVVPGSRRLLGAPKPEPVVRREVPMLAPLASLGPLALTKPPAWAPPPVVERKPARPAPVKPAPAPFVARPRTEPCCWVTTLGAKGKLPLYCNDESAPGKPYCPEHASRVYVKIRDRSEDAAHAMGGD
jgi:GcrA cell cycle regulator